MKIELLYGPGCPNHAPAAQMVREVLAEFGLCLDIIEIEVADHADAVTTGFPGSPTIRIDGRDVEPGFAESGQFGLSCRIYLVNGRRQGVPDREWIRRAIQTAASRKNDASEGIGNKGMLL
jgi:hypothetical protein